MTNNIDKKLELYFFDPWKDENKYTERFFQINNTKTKAYSPLYLMRRQILLLSGKLIQFPVPPIWQTPYFSAILLANIAIGGLRDLSKLSWKVFYKNYFDLEPIQHTGLRILRNALEHNNFQLYHRVYNKAYKENKNKHGKREFNEIDNYLKKNKKIGQKINLKFFKVNFVLYSGDKKEIILPPKVDKVYNNNSDRYALITFNVWPFEFLSQFEKATEEVKQNILHRESLKNYFDKSVTYDNWMKAGETK